MSKGKSKPIRARIETPFSVHLLELQERHRLTLRAIAEIAGVNPAVVSNWIHGHSVPHNLFAVQKLCDSLGCDFEFLLTGRNRGSTCYVAGCQCRISSNAPENSLPESLKDGFEIVSEAGLTGMFAIEIKRLRPKGESKG